MKPLRTGGVRRPMPVGRQFAKGVSGNPGGRPKAYAEIKALAAQHCPEALALLVAQMNNPELDERLRQLAAIELLDRGIGKATQALELNPGGGSLVINLVAARSKDDDAREPPVARM